MTPRRGGGMVDGTTDHAVGGQGGTVRTSTPTAGLSDRRGCPMVRIGASECQVIRIQDADGTPLTTAMVGVVGGDGEISLDEVDDPSVLMDYYFGRGERWVVV